MITSLYIRNLAIIKELHVNFRSGLNIITGETGAGKSVIINAISLLLGARFSRDHIRTGAEKTIIEGIFKTDSNKLVIIRRIFSIGGKSRIFINDEPAKLNNLHAFTEKRIDMHGQHDHQRLLNSQNHLDYLDSFGDYGDVLGNVSDLYFKLKHAQDTLATLVKQKDDMDEKRELYSFQMTEIEKFPIAKELDNHLNEEYKRLNAAQEIIMAMQEVTFQLDESESAVIRQLTHLQTRLSSLSEIDPKIKQISERIETLGIELSDILQDASIKAGSTKIDEEKLAAVEEHMAHLETLKRKYGGSLNEVLTYYEQISTALIGDQHIDDTIKQMNTELSQIETELRDACNALTKSRAVTLKLFEKIVTEHVADMDMQSTEFKISLTKVGQITDTGQDQCEFFIRTNIGEELRPLVKIASGGEISRIMLAIKLALQAKDAAESLIFDEIDSGISGATAEKVGKKIEALGTTQQIICISHLSQIAGKGNSHFKVSKSEENGRTITHINQLNRSERVSEIASLISGKEITEISLKQAKYLLKGVHG